ncbi:MAG: hypothetical protein ACYC9Q_02790 [Bacillota bacterium]
MSPSPPRRDLLHQAADRLDAIRKLLAEGMVPAEVARAHLGHLLDHYEKEDSPEAGLAQATGWKADLFDYLKAQYKQAKDNANGLRIHRLAFQVSPGLSTYRELKAVTRRADWPAVENECLAVLSPRVAELVRVHLYEKQYDLALECLMREDRSYSSESRDDIAAALAKPRRDRLHQEGP